MKLPSFSAICCTFGRSRFLSETVAMFIAQDYAGEFELVIFNSFEKQEIVCNAPRIKVINSTRPASIGECRNRAIEAASGDWILTIDDDDATLRHFISTFAKHITDDISWLWISKQFYSEQNQIKDIVKAGIQSVAFRKSVWKQVGGFAPISFGEDTQFLGRLTEATKGKIIDPKPEEIGHVYGWDNGSPHISGLGADSSTKPAAYAVAAEEVERRVKSGKEPIGRIEISPKCSVNWQEQADAIVAARKTTKRDDVCIVLLGRHGDIINALPIAKHIHDTYGTPHWMVSREFAPTLDGVSYVHPYVVDLPNHELGKAMKIATENFRFVLGGQIWGRNFAQTRNTDAYNKESWRNCGFLNRFDDKTWLPVFDRRDAERELELVDYVTQGYGRPFIIVQVTQSISSPFPAGKHILEEIENSYGTRFQIVDVAGLRCHRIYDLLGLMDRAACVVACDTSLLHLAAASDVPVVALTNPKPWLGTATRCHCVARMTYHTAEPLKVLGAIEKAVTGKRAVMRLIPPVAHPSRLLFHAVDVRPLTGVSKKERARLEWARNSWAELYANHGVLRAHFQMQDNVHRTADKTIGDPRPLPYLKDILKQAMDKADDSDIIVFSNDDVFLHPELPDLLRFHVSLYDVCTSRRCEIEKPLPAGATPADYAIAHLGHCGRDLFAATKAWLVKHWDEIPDAIVGSSRYDLVLAYLVREYHGFTLADISSLEENAWPAELPNGYVAHLRHESLWAKPSNHDSPSEKHNRKIYEDYVERIKR